MAGKRLTGRVWFRVFLCLALLITIVACAFTFGGEPQQ
jgi:hypothetical protein